MNTPQTFAMPVARVLIATIFLMFGANKIFAYQATAGWMEAMGLPGALLPLVIALELIGGVAIVVGWHARWFALALAGFCIVSAVVFHANFADQTEMAQFLKNVAIAGGFLVIFANGAGAYSLDNRQRPESTNLNAVST